MSSTLRLQADIVIATSREVYAPGQVAIEHGRVREVTGCLDATPDITLDGVAISPGLVNPHTHLEFSDLSEPLAAGENFPQWISNVLAFRQQRTGPALEKPAAILDGLKESADCGVAALADIVTFPWSTSDLVRQTPRVESVFAQFALTDYQRYLINTHLPPQLPKVIACIEQLGLSPDRRQQFVRWRDEVLAAPESDWPDWLIELGLSPHAPYSTPLELVEQTVSLAAHHHRLVAMHVAESPAERQWLDEGTGPMADMLERFGISTAPPPGLVDAIIDSLARGPRSLLIHGNYLNAQELEHLAKKRARVRVVYCPRTHRHFGHTRYPLQQLHAHGVSVVLGTDSRSTNPDLNLWSEAVEALAQHPWLCPSQAFAAITSDAAVALGIEANYGSLKAGASAQLTLTPLPGPYVQSEELFAAMLSANAMRS